MASNKVIKGDYLDYFVSAYFSDTVSITNNDIKIELTKDNVETYEVITHDSKKSASSAVLRGLGGAMILGPVGLLAGLSAKNKDTILLALIFKNGKKSLLEIDGKTYQKLMSSIF